MKPTILPRLLLFVIALSSTFTCFAQRSLINQLSWLEFDVPDGKQVFIDSLLANPLYDSIWPVEVDYLPYFQEDGELEFNLPDYDSTLYASARQVRFKDSTDFVWSGEFTGNDDGDMMLIERDGAVFGYFFIDSTVGYELMDLGNHKNILVKYSPLYFDTTVADCAYTNPSEDIVNNYNSESRGSCDEDAIPIRILVYVSDAAYKKIIPEQKVDLFIEQLNFALDNSALTIDQIYFEIAAILPFSDIPGNSSWDESLEIDEDLGDVRSVITSSLIDPRDAYGADLVCLLTDGNYDNCKTVGLAYQQNPGDPEWGFSLVEGDGGLKYTFGHEIAHNLGCGHHDNTLLPAYARGFFWKNNGKRKSTMMVSGGTGKQTRILWYSNPDVSVAGHVTGIENSRDNARQLVEARDAVADNFCSEPTMIAIIKGPRYGISNYLYTYVADVLFCSSVTNYKWEKSIDGINFIGLGQGSTLDEITIYLNYFKRIWLRVTVSCSNSQTYTDVIMIQNVSELYPFVTNQGNLYPTGQDNLTFLGAYPIPAKGEINLAFNLQDDANVSIFRSDLLGKSIKLHEGFYIRGSHTFIDHESRGLNGIYLYSVRVGKETKATQTIISN